ACVATPTGPRDWTCSSPPTPSTASRRRSASVTRCCGVPRTNCPNTRCRGWPKHCTRTWAPVSGSARCSPDAAARTPPGLVGVVEDVSTLGVGPHLLQVAGQAPSEQGDGDEQEHEHAEPQ